MTENELRSLVVSTAKKYLGCKESDGSHRKIIDTYNAHKPLARSYKVKYTDAWCATFVSTIGILCDLVDIMPTECGCGQMIQLYKNKGRWQENDAYTPKIGDIVMYDWDDNGSGDCTGWPEHVGIVASVSGSTLQIIEGNISNAVGYRNLKVNGKNIRGYCVPNYASKATKASSSATKPSSSTTAQKVDPARSFDRMYAKTYTVTASALNMRKGAGTHKGIVKVLKNGALVTCYGYYTKHNEKIWLFVRDSNGDTGFCSKAYLK